MDKNRPIGIFDSGVGGLTVAKAIAELLPAESFIYFGDTRHAPYGDKSSQTIREYSQRISRFLVAQIEEGFAGTDVSKGALAHYLNHSSLKKLSDLILGCTHYPLLEEEIAAYLGPQVRVLNSAKLAASTLLEILAKQELLSTSVDAGKRKFYVSEKTPAFTKIARMFFGQEIRLEEKFLKS